MEPPIPAIKHDDICTSLILTHFLVTPEAKLSNSMEVTMKQVVLRLLQKKSCSQMACSRFYVKIKLASTMTMMKSHSTLFHQRHR